MGFASNLRQLLNEQDIELKELSAKTGISKNTLDNYLSGQKSIPNAENAVKIAQVLGVSVEYLVSGESAKSTSQTEKYPAKIRFLADKLMNFNDNEYSLVKVLVEEIDRQNK